MRKLVLALTSAHPCPKPFSRVRPTHYTAARQQFLAFWVRAGCALAGMNVNVWDVQDDIQALVRAGFAGIAVDAGKLADPTVPLAALVPSS